MRSYHENNEIYLSPEKEMKEIIDFCIEFIFQETRYRSLSIDT